MSAAISISDTRTLGREIPELRDQALELIAAAESLRDAHEADCGCDRPGSPATCIWPTPAGRLLASFDFDEEVTR